MTRKQYIKGFVICIIACICTNLSAQEIEKNIYRQIKKILRYDVDLNKKDTPGFIVGILDGDSTFVVNYGSQVGNNRSISDSSYYDIGGLTKVYVAIVANELIKQGILIESETLDSIFPEFQGTEFGSITIIQLIQHTSGIPVSMKHLYNRRDLVFKRKNKKRVGQAFEELEWGDLVNACYETDLKNQKSFEYNHHDYTILAQLILTKTGKSVYDWYESMRSTNELLPPFPKYQNHQVLGLSRGGIVSSKVDYTCYENSLGGETNVKHLLRLSKYLLTSYDNNHSLFHSPVPTEIDNNIKFTKGLYEIKNGKHHSIYGHGGRSNRHSCSIHIVPETKTAVVILANSESGTKDLYLSLLSMVNNQWKRKS